jgi:hypothetical protein
LSDAGGDMKSIKRLKDMKSARNQTQEIKRGGSAARRLA